MFRIKVAALEHFVILLVNYHRKDMIDCLYNSYNYQHGTWLQEYQEPIKQSNHYPQFIGRSLSIYFFSFTVRALDRIWLTSSAHNNCRLNISAQLNRHCVEIKLLRAPKTGT